MAVFTDLSLDTLRDNLNAFGLEDLTSMVGLQEGIENSTYMLMNAHSHFILTIFERRVEEEDLCFFDQLMALMRENGISVPRLLKSRDGSSGFYVKNKLCIIQSFISGITRNAPFERDCYHAGQTLAKMHLTATRSNLSRHNPVGHETWIPMFKRVVGRLRGEWISRIDSIYNFLEVIKTEWPECLPAGPVHADYFKENILFSSNGGINVFDFFLGCRELFAYDLALALTSWGFSDEGLFLRKHFESFLLGYSSERRLSSDERGYLPFLLQAASIRILMTRLTDEMDGRHPNVNSDKTALEFWRKFKEIGALEATGQLGILP